MSQPRDDEPQTGSPTRMAQKKKLDIKIETS